MKSEQELIAKIEGLGWAVLSSDAGIIRFRLPASKFKYTIASIAPWFDGDGWTLEREDSCVFTAHRWAEPIPMRKITAHKGGRTVTTTLRLTPETARLAGILREEHGLSMADLLDAAVKQKMYELRK